MTADRAHPRIPCEVAVQFRTASAFLVAYSVNLSRGGIFVETDADLPLGTAVDLAFDVPGASELKVAGTVSWRRTVRDADGGVGIGLAFSVLTPELGSLIDGLVVSFTGLSILVVAADRHDRTALARVAKSIFANAQIVTAADVETAEAHLGPKVDLIVVELNGLQTDAAAWIRHALDRAHEVPVVALAPSPQARADAATAGAAEVLPSDATAAELHVAALRAVGKPLPQRRS